MRKSMVVIQRHGKNSKLNDPIQAHKRQLMGKTSASKVFNRIGSKHRVSSELSSNHSINPEDVEQNKVYDDRSYE